MSIALPNRISTLTSADAVAGRTASVPTSAASLAADLAGLEGPLRAASQALSETVAAVLGFSPVQSGQLETVVLDAAREVRGLRIGHPDVAPEVLDARIKTALTAGDATASRLPPSVAAGDRLITALVAGAATLAAMPADPLYTTSTQ